MSGTDVGEWIDRAIAADRKLRPEHWEKVDHIAELIDPGAFAVWYDSLNDDAEPVPPDARRRYMQSRAREMANRILVYLGLAPAEHDWAMTFGEMFGNGGHQGDG